MCLRLNEACCCCCFSCCCCCFGFVNYFFLQGFCNGVISEFRASVSVWANLPPVQELFLLAAVCNDNWTDCVLLYFYGVCLQKKNNVWPRSFLFFFCLWQTLHSSLLVINPGERKKRRCVLPSIQFFFFCLNMLISLDFSSYVCAMVFLSVQSHLWLLWMNEAVLFF